MYKQDVAQTSLNSIVPDLATSWSWNEDGTEPGLFSSDQVMG
jgi:ABC-type transport system substrate-binding protein